MALRFFTDNDERNWKGGRIVESKGDRGLIYAAQTPTDTLAEVVTNAVDTVLFTADAMEKELSAPDPFGKTGEQKSG